jgi:hypothetical protein
MNAASRLAIASSLLFIGVDFGTAGAQVPGTSGQEELLPLDGPTTRLEPVPPANLPPAAPDPVPPEARVKRDRVPGAPSRRRDAGTKPASTIVGNQPAWRRTGPPADHPNDSPGAAPGADYFYLGPHYAPDGDNVTWKPGFWAQVQPGWDWVPARWVRRADGWDFRPGSWVRETSTLAQNDGPNPRSTARPLRAEPPSSAVEPDAQPANPEIILAEPPAIVRDQTERGVIPGAPIPETGPLPPPQVMAPPGSVVVGAPPPPPVFIGTVTGMRYFVLRPPGYFPYGPTGVVVPGVVPRFVRNMLNRVLP